MTAAVLPRLAPACDGCAGGGEINGLPCRDCAGRGRVAPRRRLRWDWRPLKRRLAFPAATAAGTLLRLMMPVPGVAGASGVTIGVAMIAHGLVPRIPLLGAALLAGGVFGILLDRRL